MVVSLLPLLVGFHRRNARNVRTQFYADDASDARKIHSTQGCVSSDGSVEAMETDILRL